MIELDVHLAQDRETGRWFIARSDIPGLWLEAATAPALMERIAIAAPELIDLNAEEIFGTAAGGATAAAAIRPVFDSPLLLDAA